MKIKHILFLIICIPLLSACAQTLIRGQVMRAAKPWTITLLVTGNAGNASMRVNTPPMRGCKSAKEGCMIFSKGEKGEITFNMSGNDSGWHITELKICKGSEAPDPLDANCPLDVNALDFYVMHPNGNVLVPNFITGEITWTYDDAIKTFVLNDRNLLDQKYYYLVVACDGPNSTDHCVTADPPLDNKGLH